MSGLQTLETHTSRLPHFTRTISSVDRNLDSKTSAALHSFVVQSTVVNPPDTITAITYANAWTISVSHCVALTPMSGCVLPQKLMGLHTGNISSCTPTAPSLLVNKENTSSAA